MKSLFILFSLLSASTTAMASNLSNNGPLVQAWTKGLPAVTSLHGEAGCEAISFLKQSDGTTDLKIGDKVDQGWLGIDGAQIDSTTLTQKYSGGGIWHPKSVREIIF